MITITTVIWIFLLSTYMPFFSGLYGGVTITFALMVFIVTAKRPLEREILGLSAAFLVSLFVLIFAALVIDFDINSSVLLRQRFWFLQFILAISSVRWGGFLLDVRGREYHNSVVRWGIWSLIAVGVWQMVGGGAGHLSFFGPEPSYGAAVLLFWTFLLVVWAGGVGGFGFKDKCALAFSIILILFSGSKAALITIFIFFSLLSIFSMRLFWRACALAGLLSALWAIRFYELSSDVQRIENLLVVLYERGVDGLSYRYGVFDSFIVRVGGWIASANMLTDYPLGVGFGVFNEIFNRYIAFLPLDNQSIEMYGIQSGMLYATPKSYLLEMALGVGMVGMLILAFSLRRGMRGAGRVQKIAFFCLIIQAFQVELAPYLAYVFLTAVFSSWRDKGTAFT